MSQSFTASGGIIYLNTLPISLALADELLTLFANEGAVDLVAELTRVRRKSRGETIPTLKPLTCVVRKLDPAIWGDI